MGTGIMNPFAGAKQFQINMLHLYYDKIYQLSIDNDLPFVSTGPK